MINSYLNLTLPLNKIRKHLSDMLLLFIISRYALICRPSPDEWSDKLRHSFLKGFKSFLKMLKMMQVNSFEKAEKMIKQQYV